MKFHELAACLAPGLPGGLASAERMRELISMFTTVTEDEWGINRDPSALPSDSVLESMASRASGFTKKHANAICPRLDIAVLRSTPLPFLIHDSAIIKLIAFAPVAELLAVYTNTANLTSRAGEPKQVFFSFDATKAYGTKTEKRVAPAQVIHLGEGTEALDGSTWNTETTDHHDPQPQRRSRSKVTITFKPLWKLLIDRDMTKEDLRLATGLSAATIAKMGKDGNVTTEVLARISTELNCNLEQNRRDRLSQPRRERRAR